jgi:phosphohistidine phosphatase
MELILWRHAQAEDGTGDDQARALTKRGRKQAARMAEWLGPRLTGDWTVLASPAKRALETAEALGRPLDVRPAIGTSASARDILGEAGWPDAAGNVVVVGHQPTLGEVAGRLLGAHGGIAVRKGAIWWFEAREGEAVLKATLDPDLLD